MGRTSFSFTSCVEVPTFADDAGLHPTVVGALPPQCAAACMTNVNVQTLTADAALSGDPEHIVHALIAVVDRLVVLHGGTFIGAGDPKAVINSPAVREVYMGIAADA